jgi:hypothetical protein
VGTVHATSQSSDTQQRMRALQAGQDCRTSFVLTRLHRALEATHTFPGVSEVIDARVPILTGRLISGLPADVSYQRAGELDLADAGIEMMAAQRAHFPELQPLLVILKAILRERGLNKARAPVSSAAQRRSQHARCSKGGCIAST